MPTTQITLRNVQIARFVTPGARPPTFGQDALLAGEEAFNIPDQLRFFGIGDGTFLTLSASGGPVQANTAALVNGPNRSVSQLSNVAGTLTVTGFTTATPRTNDALILTAASGLQLGTGAKIDNRGYMVGLGVMGADYYGTLGLLEHQGFARLYSAAVTGHSTGIGNGVMGTALQNGQGGQSFPCALVGYGLNKDAGNTVFGIFGRAESQAAGCVTNELNTFNFFGDPDDFTNGFPNRAFGITKANPVTLTLACGGTFRSTAALHITREGGSTNTAASNYRTGIFMQAGNVTDYGLYIDSDGQNNTNNGHGGPKNPVFIRVGPDTVNGFCAQAVGRSSTYAGRNPYLLALISNLNLDNDTPDSANVFNCFSVQRNADITGRSFSLTGTGLLTTADGANCKYFLTPEGMSLSQGAVVWPAASVSTGSKSPNGNYVKIFAGGGLQYLQCFS